MAVPGTETILAPHLSVSTPAFFFFFVKARWLQSCYARMSFNVQLFRVYMGMTALLLVLVVISTIRFKHAGSPTLQIHSDFFQQPALLCTVCSCLHSCERLHTSTNQAQIADCNINQNSPSNKAVCHCAWLKYHNGNCLVVSLFKPQTKWRPGVGLRLILTALHTAATSTNLYCWTFKSEL